MKQFLITSLVFGVFLFPFTACSPSDSTKASETQLKADSLTIHNSINTQVPRHSALPANDPTPITFTTVRIEHPRGDTFNLYIPKGFKLKLVAHGMNRVRFMDRSSDGKLFLTDMINLSDNSKGRVYRLDGLSDSMTFNRRIIYLENLRNPNSLVFHQDKQGKQWLYIAMTDKLLRYLYNDGDEKPTSEPEVLDTFPDYGLSYRYGGWHLTRTIQFGSNGKLYLSVGSSCNVCVEKEEVRAAVLEMDEDGKSRRIFAKGIRNAVGLSWAEGNLYATNMAADHLGKDQPDDAMFLVENGKHYGWPYCYHWKGKVYADPMFDTATFKINPTDVPGAFSYLGAHTAPLGLAWFGEENASDPVLKNYFIVAQHGSYTPAIGRGYGLQRIRENRAPEDLVKGFLDAEGNVHGRPCGILADGNDRLYFTDDKFGTLYLLYK